MLNKENDIFKLVRKVLIKFKYFYKKEKNVDICSVKELKNIPFLSRDNFKNIRDYISLKDVFFTIMTSGSEEEKLFIYRNKKSYYAHLARQIKIYRKAGVTSKDKFLNLLSYSIAGAARIIDRALEEIGVSYIPVGSIKSNQHLRFAVKSILQLQPTVIEGYVNEIYDVFLMLGKNHSIKKCILTGEFLSCEFKDKIQKMSGVEIYNNYGSMEFSGIAISENNNDDYMRMYEDDIYIEVIKDNGELANIGKGQLVVTDLKNDAMPLIRYQLGDMVEIIKRGRKKYIKILGRTGDSILIDGEPFSKRILIERIRKIVSSPQFFISITKNHHNYQDKLAINILKKDSGKCKQIEKFVRNNLRLSHIFQINFHNKEIPKTFTGKYRHIIDLRKDDQ